jgi:hypothetical protein
LPAWQHPAVPSPSIPWARFRLAPRPFAVAALAVYLLSFVSQALLAPPLTARTGPLPFALAQALLIAAWLLLHAGRLRDAGLGSAPALGIAVLYALAVALLALLIEPILGPGLPAVAAEAPPLRWADFWVLPLVVSALAAEPSLNLFFLLAMVMLLLVLLPMAIALGFSIWTATRPRAGTEGAVP